jgi:hypothetical protein
MSVVFSLGPVRLMQRFHFLDDVLKGFSGKRKLPALLRLYPLDHIERNEGRYLAGKNHDVGSEVTRKTLPDVCFQIGDKVSIVHESNLFKRSASAERMSFTYS